MGGLGNQMAQYAFGKMVAIFTDMPLKFDTAYFRDKNKEHEYGLDKLSIKGIEFATFFDIIRVKSPIPKYIPQPSSYFTEKTLAYDNSIVDKVNKMIFLKESTYFDGYWLNERYFYMIRDTLIQSFMPTAQISEANKAIMTEIANTNSITIHIRRGNYVTKPNVSDFLGACDIVYYQRAIAYIEERIENPHYFIFSNDPAWAQENLKLKNPATLITNNANEPQEDLRLMSICKHFIIANSSFSWWSAWLSQNPDKIVVTPAPWFLNKQANEQFEIPTGWLKISRE